MAVSKKPEKRGNFPWNFLWNFHRKFRRDQILELSDEIEIPREIPQNQNRGTFCGNSTGLFTESKP